MTSQPTLLLDFPNEVLLLIAECLESPRIDLSAFACACARLTEVADPCLYRRIQIRSEDQAERLSNALHRRPQRCSFIRQLLLAPAIEHAHNIIHKLRFVLDLMHLVEDLTVVLPFCYSPAFAEKIELGYRDRFGDIFEAASIVSCVGKPRAFQALRSCESSLLAVSLADLLLVGVLYRRIWYSSTWCDAYLASCSRRPDLGECRCLTTAVTTPSSQTPFKACLALSNALHKDLADSGSLPGKLNFQEQRGAPWSLGVHSMVFLHDNLESLTLVAALIDTQDVDCLRHHRKLTQLSCLHFDHCSISSPALKIVLSIPRALQSLKLTEYDYGRTPYQSTGDQEELKIALSPQEDSLRDLHLGLGFQRQGFITPYDISSFTKLQKLTLECTKLDGVLHSSPMLQDGMIKISEVTGIGTRQIVWITLPKRPFSLELQTAPGHRLADKDVQRAIERLGRSLRRSCESVAPQSLPVFETRLVVVRQTEPSWAVPSYLHDYDGPEKVICYDSFGSTPSWDYMTDADNVRTLQEGTFLPSPNVTVNASGATVYLI